MNRGPTLRQPDWWNSEDEITSISKLSITGKLGKLKVPLSHPNTGDLQPPSKTIVKVIFRRITRVKSRNCNR